MMSASSPPAAAAPRRAHESPLEREPLDVVLPEEESELFARPDVSPRGRPQSRRARRLHTSLRPRAALSTALRSRAEVQEGLAALRAREHVVEVRAPRAVLGARGRGSRACAARGPPAPRPRHAVRRAVDLVHRRHVVAAAASRPASANTTPDAAPRPPAPEPPPGRPTPPASPPARRLSPPPAPSVAPPEVGARGRRAAASARRQNDEDDAAAAGGSASPGSVPPPRRRRRRGPAPPRVGARRRPRRRRPPSSSRRRADARPWRAAHVAALVGGRARPRRTGGRGCSTRRRARRTALRARAPVPQQRLAPRAEVVARPRGLVARGVERLAREQQRRRVVRLSASKWLTSAFSPTPPRRHRHRFGRPRTAAMDDDTPPPRCRPRRSSPPTWSARPARGDDAAAHVHHDDDASTGLPEVAFEKNATQPFDLFRCRTAAQRLGSTFTSSSGSSTAAAAAGRVLTAGATAGRPRSARGHEATPPTVGGRQPADRRDDQQASARRWRLDQRMRGPPARR